MSAHTLRQTLTFTTDAGPLDVHVCTCGRMFDATRFAVQCDGCGYSYMRPHLAQAVILSGIRFNARAAQRGDKRRLCRDRAKDAGWGS